MAGVSKNDIKSHLDQNNNPFEYKQYTRGTVEKRQVRLSRMPGVLVDVKDLKDALDYEMFDPSLI